mmetsp:Transcript_26807/g.75482  ORF Transcript_26807/g.75482 Transcript_26807/m.75482 type:complete len:319 (-) Transcript_26807:1199-2155(-)
MATIQATALRVPSQAAAVAPIHCPSLPCGAWPRKVSRLWATTNRRPVGARRAPLVLEAAPAAKANGVGAEPRGAHADSKDMPQSLWPTGSAMFPYSGGVHSLIDGQKLPCDKEVVLVRHGMSTWNLEGRIQGNTDDSTLTEQGEEQARAVRASLRNIPFDSCFSSSITRARRSAEIIWEEREEPLIFMDELREADLMILQGMKNVDAEKEYPELFRTWREMPHLFCVNGEYPVVNQWDRAAAAWQKILQSPGRLHLVVTHKSILRAMVCTALGLPPSAFRAIDIHNSGVSRFRVNQEGEAMLVNLNLTSHLHCSEVRY